MKLFLLLFAAISLSATAFATDSLNMNYGGVNRGFWVHTPPSYSAGQHLPMVFNFHGYGSFASEEELYTQMDNVADTGKFIVVYPSGIGAAWNVGWFGSFWTGPDDVGFTSAIIDTMIKLYGIDSTRVYSCGMSNGGFMSHLLASVLSNRITAVAAVSGVLTDSAVAYFTPSRLIPLMDIHGTKDPVVPYDTFPVSLDVEQTINFWVSRNSRSLSSDTTFLPNINTADSSTVQKIDYPAQNDAAEVLFYKIINGGHTWPNGIIDIPVASYGFTNRDIDANTEIWHFFNKYKINIATGLTELAVNDNGLRIFPNPLSGSTLQIELADDMTNAVVEVMDANGKVVVRSSPAQSNPARIEMPSDLSAGLYLVKISAAGNTVVKKLVKF